ncbi:MAG: Sua5/YciO/YrdC/YwlC family protein [Candidatus Woesearchaeota archaeon]|jgi:L-threonylcarbamoyladenylate synthase
MQVISRDELNNSKKKYLKLMKSKVFIYPTDSIYGIGCDATDATLVSKIRKLKKSTLQPFSIIAPSKEWVYANCVVEERQKPYVESLGKKLAIAGKKTCFTVILKLKNKNAVAKNVDQGTGNIGVRIPEHWISELVSELGSPIVTTSANPTGEDFMTSLDDLNEIIKDEVDFIIYEGEKKGSPSTIIHSQDEVVKIKERR